jgi:hypothetical protein
MRQTRNLLFLFHVCIVRLCSSAEQVQIDKELDFHELLSLSFLAIPQTILNLPHLYQLQFTVTIMCLDWSTTTVYRGEGYTSACTVRASGTEPCDSVKAGGACTVKRTSTAGATTKREKCLEHR